MGEFDSQGIISVRFINGESLVQRVDNSRGIEERGRKKTRRNKKEFKPPKIKSTPCNAIFVRNSGRLAVTVRRCTYTADLGGVRFSFEPQPGSSPCGDLLPKRLEPGDEAIIIHEKYHMRGFLHAVLKDHDVTEAAFLIKLGLGDGKEITVDSVMAARANMTDVEYAKVAPYLTREERKTNGSFVAPSRRFGRHKS